VGNGVPPRSMLSVIGGPWGCFWLGAIREVYRTPPCRISCRVHVAWSRRQWPVRLPAPSRGQRRCLFGGSRSAVISSRDLAASAAASAWTCAQLEGTAPGREPDGQAMALAPLRHAKYRAIPLAAAKIQWPRKHERQLMADDHRNKTAMDFCSQLPNRCARVRMLVPGATDNPVLPS
jgi:hypothetical protein